MSCVFDPEAVFRENEDNSETLRGGTHAPVVTIVLLIFATLVGVMFNFRKHIREQVMAIKKRKPKEEREPSMSELEVMELDPFRLESRHIKTFSVRNGSRTLERVQSVTCMLNQ